MQNETSSERPGKRTIIFLRWLIAAAVFFYIGQIIIKDWAQLREARLAIHLLPLLGASVLLCMHFYGAALLWQFLTRFARVDLPLLQGLYVWFYSFLGKYIPGKVAILIGRVSFYKEQGFSIRKTTLLFMLENIIQLFAALLLILLALLEHAAFPYPEYRAVLICLAAILLITMHPKLLQGLLNGILTIIGKDTIDLFITYRQIALLLAGALINLLVLGWAVFLFINGLYPFSIDHYLYILATFLFASWVGIFSLITPGGIGVRDGIFFFALLRIMPEPHAALIVIVLRIWTLCCELLSFLTVYILSKRPLRPPP